MITATMKVAVSASKYWLREVGLEPTTLRLIVLSYMTIKIQIVLKYVCKCVFNKLREAVASRNLF